MKNLIVVFLASLFLTGCITQVREVGDPLKNISGYYYGGQGSIEGVSILRVGVIDMGNAIDTQWVLETGESLLCKYAFLEELDDTLYFLTIPPGALNTVVIKKENNNILSLRNLGLVDNLETDPCKKVEITLKFAKLKVQKWKVKERGQNDN